MLLSEYLSNDRIPRARSHEALANDLEREGQGLADQHVVNMYIRELNLFFKSYSGLPIRPLDSK